MELVLTLHHFLLVSGKKEVSGSDFEVLSEAETGASDHEIIRANEIEAPALKIS